MAIEEAEEEAPGMDAAAEGASAEKEVGEKSVEPAEIGTAEVMPTLTGTLTPTGTPAVMDDHPTPTPTPTTTPQWAEILSDSRPTFSFLRILEVTLGAAIIGFGAAALLTKRRRKR